MENKRRQKIKIVIANPEAIPVAQEKMAKFIYEEYIKRLIEDGTLEEEIKRIKDGNK